MKGFAKIKDLKTSFMAESPFGLSMGVYNSQIIWAVLGLRAACSHITARFGSNVLLCLGNQQAALL